MNCDYQAKIESCIEHNDWKAFDTLLQSAHGFIGNTYGGRYFYGANKDHGYADIDRVCRQIFNADNNLSLKRLPRDQRIAASRVINKLRDLYDETGKALANASYVEQIATRIYDFREAIKDGYLPIHRIEDCILKGGLSASLSNKIKSPEEIAALKAVLAKNPMERLRGYEEVKKKDMLRRIPKEEWERLLAMITALNRDFLTLEALDGFRLGRWDHAIFKTTDWHLLAFYAYLEGLIEESHFSKLILYYSCCAEASVPHGVRTFQLINNDETVNDVALAALKSEMKEYFDDECIKELVGKVRALPPEESQFFQIQRRINDSTISQNHPNALFYDFNRIRFRLFSSTEALENETVYTQTVLPLDLWHEILKTKFQSNARKPNPVLGFHKIEKMSDKDQRVVSLALGEQVKLPNTIDHIGATPLGHYFHDAIYHLFTDSSNMHRAVWIQIAKHFKENGLPKTAKKIFDGDFIAYRWNAHLTKDSPDKFLGKKLEKNEELFWDSLIRFALRGTLKTSAEEQVELFFQCFDKYAKEWEEMYGLSRQSLHSFLLGYKGIGAPSRIAIDFCSVKHVIYLFAQKLGLQDVFGLWEEYPKFPAKK